MPSISVNTDVDVELDEFDFNDIIDYVTEEIKMRGREGELKKLRNALSIAEDGIINIQSLDDRMKYEHIAKVFHKYSTDYFEKQLPA